jgi:GT2 family glycosyltransferase
MWLLNNDTVIDRDCLDALMAVGEKDDRIGLLSPIVYEYAAPHAIQFFGHVQRTLSSGRGRGSNEARSRAKTSRVRP